MVTCGRYVLREANGRGRYLSQVVLLMQTSTWIAGDKGCSPSAGMWGLEVGEVGPSQGEFMSPL